MLPLLAPIAKSIFSTVDKVITSKAEKEKIKAELQHKIITGDLKEIEAAATVIQLEAQGTWLQRSWRPIMMLLFAALMVAHWFGFTAPNIPESVQNSLLDIIMIGVGGYTVGRSAEKIGQQWQNKNCKTIIAK